MATDFHCERKAASTDAPRATPLLLVLREGLKLTGKRVAEMTNWGKKSEGRYSGSQGAGIDERAARDVSRARRSQALPKYRSTATPARSWCTTSGAQHRLRRRGSTG